MKSLVINSLTALPFLFCVTAANADGSALAAACTSCHGPEGRGGGPIPALAGRPAADLLAWMQAFAPAGADATIMPRLMRDYEEAEMKALADYFAAVTP